MFCFELRHGFLFGLTHPLDHLMPRFQIIETALLQRIDPTFQAHGPTSARNASPNDLEAITDWTIFRLVAFDRCVLRLTGMADDPGDRMLDAAVCPLLQLFEAVLQTPSLSRVSLSNAAGSIGRLC